MPARTIIAGEADLISALQRQQSVMAGSNLDAAIRDALSPLEDVTRANARMRRQVGYNPPGGHLDQGIVTQKVSATGRYRREFWTTFTRRARKIAHLVEFGTAPHWQPRRGIMHPGARPYPFFRPAYESTKDIVIARFSAWVWRAINLAIR